MVVKQVSKLSASKHKKLISDLGEDDAITLLKYCFRTMQVVSDKASEEVIAEANLPKMLSYVNSCCEEFASAGIARTGFE